MTSFYAPSPPRSPMMRGMRMPTPQSGFNDRFGHAVSMHSAPSMVPVMSTGSDNSKFQVERSPQTKKSTFASFSDYDVYDQESLIYREHVKNLLTIKSSPFTVSGRIPLDPAHLVLFFRSKTGITHSLDFPIDVDFNTPPALEVLVATCRPQPEFPSMSSSGGDLEGQTLFYPSNLPLTSSLDLSSHPVLEAIRNTLFPTLSAGHYLVAVHDKLDVRTHGQQQGIRNPIQASVRDGRSATIIITLPVRFRGGTLIVHHPLSNSLPLTSRISDTSAFSDDRFSESATGGNNDGLEWVAFLSDCDHSVEPVLQGCRISLSYAVFTKTFGPSGMQPDPLILPGNRLLDALAPILNMSRGKKIGVYLGGDYGVSPGEAMADSIVPLLKGGDSLLYHAMKASNLAPELHWTAGGYLWPLERTVDIQATAEFNDDTPTQTSLKKKNNNFPLPFGVLNGPRYTPPNMNRNRDGHGVPAVRGAFSSLYGNSDASLEGLDDLADRVIESGGISFEEASVTILADELGVVGKERVSFVSEGQLDRLVVNVLMVVYIP